MTERLYYTDSYLLSFRARGIEASPDGHTIYLDRTAFYPASGGQRCDRGEIGGVPVLEVADEGDRIAHRLAAAYRPPLDEEVECRIDAARRFDHMQQHTGQHLLSAVLVKLFEAQTISFHMGEQACTIDLAVPSLDAAALIAAERHANEVIAENRSVRVFFEDANSAEGLRKASERTGLLRIIEIEGLDRSACGGTHVRATGEVGCILLRGTEKIRNSVRLQFVCGLRAVRRARADFDALTAIARRFSSTLEEAPALVGAQAERLSDYEKARKRMGAELAGFRGRQLFSQAQPSLSGVRFHSRQAPALDDDLRVEAQAFVSAGQAVFVAACRQPAAVLVASSADSGIHAGDLVKALVTECGGRGGGSAQTGQGSIPDPGKLEDLLAAIAERVTGGSDQP